MNIISRQAPTQEGLVPLKAYVKGVLDRIVQDCLKQPDLEFVWVGDNAIDPLQQAQTLSILVTAGIKTRDEARAELGLAPGPPSAHSAKYNRYHDERGRFSTAVDAIEPNGAAPTSSVHPGRRNPTHLRGRRKSTPHSLRRLNWALRNIPSSWPRKKFIGAATGCEITSIFQKPS